MAQIESMSMLENFYKDVLNLLEYENFEEVVWVGMHGWLRYISKILWARGYQFNKILCNTGSRWGQSGFEDENGHYATCFPMDKACEIGNKAVYIIANNYVQELEAQLKIYGVASSRILRIKGIKAYEKNAKESFNKKYHSKVIPMSHREVQTATLNLLKTFKQICKENNLQYFLDCGTLLGAVRHSGFIPWDNDVDVIMPIEDYNRLQEVYPGGGRYEVVNPRNHPTFPSTHSVFADNFSIIYVPSGGLVLPFCMDIFPLVGCGNDRQEAILHRRECLKYTQRWWDYVIAKDMQPEEKIRHAWEKYLFSSVPNSRFLLQPIAYEWGVFESEWFAEPIEISFEGELFDIPKGYDQVLSCYYGDYMNLPSFENRVGHPSSYFRLAKDI